jgi:myosin heavy subunit
MDLATSLDHVLIDSQTENKFQALKILHAKKIKSLMTSIDAQQKEIGKLKVLSKDNRRTQMIQSLKKKLKDQEYVSDVLKEELSKKAELSKEEVNDYVIRKTISGPKRYRPLTREELELQIIELEKKVKVKSSSASVNGVGVTKEATPIASSSSNKKISGNSGSVNHREESKDDTQYLSKISDLQDSLYESQQACDRRDVTISQLKEEISRLRSVNSQLLVVEEERETIERQYNDLTMRYERVVEELEEALHEVGLHQEEAFQIKSECELELENHLIEIDTLREQYEKSLKQNTQLLKNMAELENLFGKNQRIPLDLSSSSVAESKSTTGTGASLQEKLKTANNKIAQLESQLKLSISSSNETATEILSLKSTLREKNNVIRDMKRNMTLVSKLSTTGAGTPTGAVSGSSSSQHSSGLASTLPPTSSTFETLLGKFTNSVLEYELLTSASGPGSVAAAAGRGGVEIRNRLFKFLTELTDALLQQQQSRKMTASSKGGSRGGGEVQIENLQKFEHVLLSRHPEIGMGDEDEEDDLNGIKIGK